MNIKLNYRLFSLFIIISFCIILSFCLVKIYHESEKEIQWDNILQHQKTGQMEKGISALNHMLKKSNLSQKERSEIYYNQANFFFLLGKNNAEKRLENYQDSLALYTRSLELNSKLIDAAKNRELVLHQINVDQENKDSGQKENPNSNENKSPSESSQDKNDSQSNSESSDKQDPTKNSSQGEENELGKNKENTTQSSSDKNQEDSETKPKSAEEDVSKTTPKEDQTQSPSNPSTPQNKTQQKANDIIRQLEHPTPAKAVEETIDIEHVAKDW